MKYTIPLFATAALFLCAWLSPDKQECDARSAEFCQAIPGPDLAPLPAGWEIVAAADFNNDHYPDLFLFNKTTGQSYIWFLQPTPRH